MQGSLAKLALQRGGLPAMTAVQCVLGVAVLALLAINRVRPGAVLLLSFAAGAVLACQHTDC
jgi:hypothetical protein